MQKFEAYTLLEELRGQKSAKLLPPMPAARSTNMDEPHQHTWNSLRTSTVHSPGSWQLFLENNTFFSTTFQISRESVSSANSQPKIWEKILVNGGTGSFPAIQKRIEERSGNQYLLCECVSGEENE